MGAVTGPKAGKASTAGKARDVCPACRRHCEQVRVVYPRGEVPMIRQARCSLCGDVHAVCDCLFLDDGERALAAERRVAYAQAWREAHREQQREYMRAYNRENSARISARLARRWRDDPEYRARRLEYVRRYAAEHPEQRRETCARYYRNHADEIYLRAKRCRLARARREAQDG